MSTPETRNALKFTKMCKYWDARRCYDGNQCSFAHTSAELRDAPSLVRTQLCYQFRKGQCSRGAACTFAHGQEELRPSSVEVQCSGDRKTGSLGITGRQNEAARSPARPSKNGGFMDFMGLEAFTCRRHERGQCCLSDCNGGWPRPRSARCVRKTPEELCSCPGECRCTPGCVGLHAWCRDTCAAKQGSIQGALSSAG